MRIVICPKCKKTNMGSMTQCLICKTPLPVNTSGTGMSQSAGQSGIKCPSCGAVCPAGARFCHQCAAPLPVQVRPVQSVGQKRFCSKCGAPRQGDRPFCTSCGYRFTG